MMEGSERGNEEGSGGVGKEVTDCSIISAQTPLGFRVRDCIVRWRDKSPLLTFERITTFSNNPLRGGSRAGRNIEVFTLATERCSSNRLLRKIRLEGWRLQRPYVLALFF